MSTEYNVKYTFDPETHKVVAEVPSLSLSDFGASFEEAEARIMDALRHYLEFLRDTGRPIPEPDTKDGTLLRIAV